MASTVDAISHGRLDLGIGAGVSEYEHRAYGYDYPEMPKRLRQLREAVQVILAMWTQEEAVFEGKCYQVRGAINQPKGVQKPHISLLIGGGKNPCWPAWPRRHPGERPDREPGHPAQTPDRARGGRRPGNHLMPFYK